MTREAKKYSLTILGQTYTVVTDEPEMLISNASNLVDSLMKEIMQNSKHLEIQKVAVLAALQCASKLLAKEAIIEKVEKREREILSVIDYEMQSSLP